MILEVFMILERAAHLCFKDANTSLYSHAAQTSFYLLGLCYHVLIDSVHADIGQGYQR